MSSRRDLPPTAAELDAWVRVATPRSATGTVVRRPASGLVFLARSWIGGEEPADLWLPPGEPVRFWFRSPGCWRYEGEAGLLAVADGRRAVAWKDGERRVGGSLWVPQGPDDLLMPWPVEDELVEEVEGPYDVLGRRCWRWGNDVASWEVDEASGTVLRVRDRTGSVELTALELDVDLPDDLFVLPAGLPEPVTYVEPEVDYGWPTAGFRVPWWPHGCQVWPVAGDPDALAVLLSLDDVGTWFLGCAPAGSAAPVQEGLQHHRWEGDGWAFALSHPPGQDVEAVVASVPREWL